MSQIPDATGMKIITLKDKYRIEILVSFLAPEYIRPIDGVKKIIDICDSRALTLERKYRKEREKLSPVHRLKPQLNLYRKKTFEKPLPMRCDLLTAVSPVDVEKLTMLAGKAFNKIALAPNGVAPELIHRDNLVIL